MRGSQFSILIANLFLIAGFLCNYMLPMLVMFMFAFLWFVSAVFNLYLEKIQLQRLSREIEYFNKIMGERGKNGNRTNKRR